MKAFLLHRDRDFDIERDLPPNEPDLTQDLELDRLLGAMAAGDKFLYTVAQRALLSSLTDPEEIEYRQRVLDDCLTLPAVIRELYDLADEAVQRGRKVSYGGSYRPSSDTILYRSVGALEIFVELLKRLRKVSDEHADAVRSEGFLTLFTMLSRELDDAYFETVEDHLRQLRFRHGALISAQLGEGNRGSRYVLRVPPKRSWRQRIPFADRSSYVYEVPPRDEAGSRALGELRARGIHLVANALGQSTDHILSFFAMLRTELGFYVGCLNLHEHLAAKGEPTCVPEPLAAGRPVLSCRGLYDVCLSLGVDERIVGNAVSAEGTSLVLITGANQGGKSTFLRSVGLAQLMMQSGMFVAAEAFRADVRDGVFTHFKREEDKTMESGKLDEELRRMSAVADAMGPNGIVLFNESFASTNEREGSEIARHIVRALLETDTKVLFVTHMFDLAHGFYAGKQANNALFLRAERQDDTSRTFRLSEGEPQPTSYGEDIYERIFGAAPANAALRSDSPTRRSTAAPRPHLPGAGS